MSWAMIRTGGPLDPIYDSLGIMKNVDHVSRDNNVRYIFTLWYFDELLYIFIS